MRHIILISGKDSLATAIVQIERSPELSYELVHNETGWDLPESLEWIQRVGQYFGREIIKCGDDLTEVCIEQNCLPLAKIRRFCTKLAKIQPLNDYMGSSPAKVYFGLRADEPDRHGWVVNADHPQQPVYPLRELGMGINEVWETCSNAGILPPSFHWQWMEDRIRHLLGLDQWLLDRLPPWEKAEKLAWRTRNNCDRCMYQMQFERIGLLEHHPDRYESMCQLEERLCHRQEHTWIGKGFRLRDLPKRAEEIKEKRARKVVRELYGKSQIRLFDDDLIDDELLTTSCGLLCGK